MNPDDPEQAPSSFAAPAYGGDGWSPRNRSHQQEIGSIWQDCGIDSEWRRLKSVLLHCPGSELLQSQHDPASVQMLAAVDVDRAIAEHQAMVEKYLSLDIAVHFVEPDQPCQPNLMFCADLFVMTPQGAILARPASTVRAGEERWVARKLAALGIPILKTLTGGATFEGADLMWIDEKTAMIGRGLRSNQLAILQLEQLLNEMGIELISVDSPYGIMHFMSLLRIVDADLAICWPRRTPFATVTALRDRGYQVVFPSFADDQESYRGINFVTLGPRRILMVANLAKVQRYFEGLGIECLTTPTAELTRAAGNVGCLSGILQREKSTD